MSVVKALGTAAVVAGVVGLAGFWFLTQPVRLDAAVLAQASSPGDAARGERIFWAGGCASCHTKPGAETTALPELPGGVALKTEFGSFVAPNISQDAADGIGRWSFDDFANAMMAGVAPDGSHLYPAFPYTSYARMTVGDVADLYAFMKTLPAVAGKAPAHELGFPFNIRRGIGLWKRLNLSSEPVIALPADADPTVVAGRYLVEGPGHCGECHTPRDITGGSKKGLWLSGAVAAEGAGKVPNLTSGEGGLGGWSAGDIAYYLESGFTPDYDSVGGAMAEVQRNMAKLPAADREAIAAYLKAIPPHPNGF